MFLGLLDPDPDPLVRDIDTDPAPDPSITQAKIVRKKLESYFFETSFDFLSLKMVYMYLQKVLSQTIFKKLISFWLASIEGQWRK
jgi:hypothetical protein